MNFASAYAEIADAFNWNRVAIMVTHEDVFSLTAHAIMSELEWRNKTVLLQVVATTITGLSIDDGSLNALKEIMASMKKKFASSSCFLILLKSAIC